MTDQLGTPKEGMMSTATSFSLNKESQTSEGDAC
jgi:hypothetical protein